MTADRLRLALRVQAHCHTLAAIALTARPSQLRNRLAYIKANLQALIDLLEEEP